MDNAKDVVKALDEIEMPSIDLDLSEAFESNAAQVEKPETYSNVPEVGENQILVEGATRLKDHPQLENLVKSLIDLRNEFEGKVKDLTASLELSASVKTLFSIDTK